MRAQNELNGKQSDARCVPEWISRERVLGSLNLNTSARLKYINKWCFNNVTSATDLLILHFNYKKMFKDY